jgi:hypothetical protein
VTALEQPSAAGRRRPPRRRRRGLRAVVGACLVMLVFAIGVALGMALRDDPEPGGTVTIVRTLEPLPQTPATAP